jgi:hypothetical protein
MSAYTDMETHDLSQAGTNVLIATAIGEWISTVTIAATIR